MRIENYSITVLLDEEANIVELKSSLMGLDLDTDVYIGKNWFDSFINISDKEKVMEVFNSLFSNEDKWKSFGNDLKFKKEHRLIDFENEVLSIDGKKYIKSHGIERLHNASKSKPKIIY